MCPCHSSSFDITGEVLSPPAPRALDLHPVRIENGIVKVDTVDPIKRNPSDAAQADTTRDPRHTLHKWKSPASSPPLVIVVSRFPFMSLKEAFVERARDAEPGPEAAFVGKEKCIKCHEKAYESWRGSDHDNAMAVAADSTVRGDFNNSVFAL